MGQVACLLYRVTVVFLGGLNIKGGGSAEDLFELRIL